MTRSNRKSAKKLLLIDGNSFFYRAYYAIRSLSTSRGEPTNAIYGFITMLNKLIEEETPSDFLICFDRAEPTFRHKKYEDYKANRKPMPDDLAEQIEPIKEFCRAYRFAMLEKAGYEADDLLGTVARKAAKKGFEVYIVTSDKDALQLVNDKVKIINPHKENLVFDRTQVMKRFDGIEPENLIDVMALMGDASDNIPGVPGIGEKTAIKLIREFGSVENLMKHVGRIKSKSQQQVLRDNQNIALLSKDLARIDTEVPVELDWEDLEIKAPAEDRLAELAKHYEFKSLMKNMTPTGESGDEKRQYRVVATQEEFKKFIKNLVREDFFSFDTETTAEDPMRAHLVGMSFSWEPLRAYYLPVASADHQGSGLSLEAVLKELKPILEDPEKKKAGQNLKYDWIVMMRHGIRLRGIAFDTMIASYLIHPIKLNHNLDDISLEHLGIRKIETRTLLGSGKNQRTMDQVPLEEVAEYACEDADCVFRLVSILTEKLESNDLGKLFLEVEVPLLEVLAKMEMNGVSLDLKFLQELSDNASKDLERLTRDIHQEADQEFNINSPKQLADVLFIQLRLPVIKRTKTGYSTDVSVLEKLAEEHDLPKKILEYREKMKLKSTYMDALPEMVHPETGLIHTSYHQTTTATGRLSSSEPNLQNIPIKTEAGRMIRKAFVPRNDQSGKRAILSADYSQIELRILAHLSEDPNLIKAFNEDRDIHRFTATLLYGVSEEDVTREMRDLAKTINFSIIYGKTAYGLAKDLSTSIKEADEFIENYFDRYRAVRDYLESQKEKARRQGYLTTILGRRSYFPDIQSRNMQMRQFAERAAINAPIQGSAADLIKLAMIRIQEDLEAEKFASLMTMQVHDELVFDAAEAELSSLTDLVRNRMEQAYSMKVPLKVDVFVGGSWYKN